MPKVLVFESDPAFAGVLTAGLAQYGCDSQVVDDGETGITLAEKDPPDLILLSIELPRMNGFSVCNKLKRNAKLKAVPLILMSSEATEDTFEQHKRLRTRAEEYLHKPLSVEDLVARVQPFVPLTKTEAVEDDFEEVAIDDEVEDADADVAFGNLMAAPPAMATSTDLGRLELEQDGKLEVAGPPKVPSVPPDSIPAEALVPESMAPPPPPAPVAKVQDSEEYRSLSGELASARARIDELSRAVSSAEAATLAEEQKREDALRRKNAELERLQGDVDDLTRKLEKNEGGGSAREFLDLREQLNKKDKEIIEIQDKLVAKEKEVIKLNDANIAGERQKADLTDQIRGLERTKAELERTRDVLTQDKAQASQRADDFKNKSERLDADLQKTTQELRTARQEHENTIAIRDAQEAALREDHRQQLVDAALAAQKAEARAVEQAIQATRQEAAVEQEAALSAAATEARQTQEVAILAREKELRSEHDSKMAALHRANEESMRKLRAEHDQALAEAAEEAADRLSAREAALRAEREQALVELEARHQDLAAAAAKARAQAEAERDARINSLDLDLAKRTDERDAARNTITDREGRIAQLEADLAATRADLVEARERWALLEGQLGQARTKWGADSAALDQALEALSDVVDGLKQARARPMP